MDSNANRGKVSGWRIKFTWNSSLPLLSWILVKIYSFSGSEINKERKNKIKIKKTLSMWLRFRLKQVENSLSSATRK